MTQPVEERMTYAEALAIAATMYAASQVPNPAQPVASLSSTILAATEAVFGMQESAIAAIRAAWRGVNPYSDSEVQRFAEDSGRTLVAAQRSVARVTAAAQTQVFEASGARGLTAPATIPDDVRGARSTGSTTARVDVGEPRRVARVTVRYDSAERRVSAEDSRTSRVMVRVAGEYRYSRSQDRSHVEATTAVDNRIRVIVDGNLQLARTIVEEQALQTLRDAIDEGVVDLDRAVIGYRRVIHPELSMGGVCGLCVVAADRKYKIGELKAIHNLCKCTVLPVFEDFDPGEQLNGEDLDALYEAADGNTRNKLKRTRYRLENHSELGPLLVPQNRGEAVPYFRGPQGESVTTEEGRPARRQPAPRRRPTASDEQARRDFAENQLRVLRENLARMRAEGRAEDSSPVQYHLNQIAKFEAQLREPASV